MSHPCHQCGAEVDEGNPFCRQCGSPQIRVNRGGEEPVNPSAVIGDHTSIPDSASLPYTDSGRSGIDRRLARLQALKAGLLLALILVLSSFFPPSLLLIPAAGLLAVQLYHRKLPQQKISAGTGAGIGLLTGFIGFLIFSIPAFPFTLWNLALHPDPAILQQLRSQLEAAIRSNPNPQAQQMAQNLLAPSGLIFISVVLFVFLLVLTLALSAIGGAIGGSLSKRRP